MTDALIERLNEQGPGQMSDPQLGELDGKRIGTILARFKVWVQAKYGIELDYQTLTSLANNRDPWNFLAQTIEGSDQGTPEVFNEIKAVVEDFHVREARTRFFRDPDRIEQPGVDPNIGMPMGEALPGEAREYRQEHRKLTDEGIDSAEAHKILRERGYDTPYIEDTSPDVLELTQQILALQVIQPESFDGEIDIARILTMDNVYDVEDYLEDEVYAGANFSQFMNDVREQMKYTSLPGVGQAAEDAIGQAITYADTSGTDAFRGFDEGEFQTVKALPLGVDEGYKVTVEKPKFGAFDYKRGGYKQTGTYEVEKEPTYFSGMQYQEFAATQSSELTLYKQSLLYEAGWLTKEQMTEEWGVGGTDTFAAMAEAMATANRQGYNDWMAAAEATARARDSEATSDPDNNAGKYAEPVAVFTPAPYMAKDPDYLAQVVKATFRNELGREPSAKEVAALMPGLGADYRAQYEEEQRKAKAEFEQQQAAQKATMEWDPDSGQYVPKGSIIGGDDEEEGAEEEAFEDRIAEGLNPPQWRWDPVNGGYIPVNETAENKQARYVSETGDEMQQPAAGGGTITVPAGYAGVEVDPIASFQEHFERIFADELARNRARETSRAADAGVQASIMMMNQAIGGG